MDTVQIADVVILFLSAISIWMVNQDGTVRRWASVVGLMVQPFWFYTTWVHQQWGIFMLAIIYTAIWVQSFYRNWFSNRKMGDAIVAPIGMIEDQIRETIPSVWTRLRRPRDLQGEWWLDAKAEDRFITIQWSPHRGFGISKIAPEDGYGEGPDETFSDQSEALKRAIDLLKARDMG